MNLGKEAGYFIQQMDGSFHEDGYGGVVLYRDRRNAIKAANGGRLILVVHEPDDRPPVQRGRRKQTPDA